jgi:4-amino-4-deoxy-L-arabinose transferase-like glycosyltransferase
MDSRKKISIIIIFSFLIRLIGVNQSLWLDEAISANVAKMPITKIVSNFSINDFHPPIFYWFLDLWTKLFGSNVAILRLSSIFFSLITIYFVFLLGKKIKNEKVGILAALFLAVNPLFVYYSQELRMYMMATMWLTIGFYYFLKIKEKKYKKIDLIIFNLLTALAFGTFYGSIFLIATFGIYFLINKKYKLFFASNIGIILAILALVPLLLIQIKNSQIMLSQVKNWVLILGKVNMKNLLLIPMKFSVGKISFYPKILYYLVAGVWSLIVFVFVFKNKRESNWLKLFLLLPLILAIIFSIKSPLLDYFRFLYLLPIMALILAINIDKKWQKILIGGGFLIFSLAYLLNPDYYREDWKNVTMSLRNNREVYMIGSFADPIKFYNPQIAVRDIKTEIPTEKEILVIPYGEEIHGINFEKKMEDLRYRRAEQVDFRGIALEEWEK